LKAADSLDDVSDSITSFDDFNTFVGLDNWREIEERYER
jgi:hypothetical protein